MFNTKSRLSYCVGGKVEQIAHLDRPMLLLGFVVRESRVFLVDKDRQVVPYKLNAAVLEYQTAVVRE